MSDDDKKDRKDRAAAVAEATPDSGTLTVTWNDQEWEIPGPTLDDAPAISGAAMEAGKAFAFLEAVLGRRQWARFTAGKRNTNRDAAELMTVIIEDGYRLNAGG